MPDDFYDEVDGMGIVENHIQQVLKLEDSQAVKILKSYKAIRQELVDRLSRARGNSFTAQHLRGVLAQVQGAIEAMNGALAGDTKEGAYDMALKSVEHLGKEITRFNEEFTGAITPINLNAALIAKDVSDLLLTRYKTNLEAYGNDLYTQIANGLFSATLGETSYSSVVGRISQFFTAEEWKLHRIVRTELHGIYGRGKIKGMQDLVDSDTIPELKKTLMHPMDARTGEDSIYLAQKHLVSDVDKPFSYKWKGKERIFMAPPDRPNDRAILVPYMEEWGSARGSAFLPES